MLAITLKHPWPWAILHCGKRIINHSWKPGSHRKGQILALHGGIPPKDGRMRDDAQHNLDVMIRMGLAPTVTLEEATVTGIFATMRYGGSIQLDDAKGFDIRWRGLEILTYGWLMHDVKRLPEPILIPGESGLWTLPKNILHQLVSQVREPLP